MPKKCYYKPNRTFPRYFTACDAARIAKQVVLDRSIPAEQVLACIAIKLGFKYIALERTEGNVNTVEASVNLLKTVGLARKTVQLVQTVLYRLKLRQFAAKLVAVLEVLDDLSRIIDEAFFAPETAQAEDVLKNTDACKCKGK